MHMQTWLWLYRLEALKRGGKLGTRKEEDGPFFFPLKLLEDGRQLPQTLVD